MSDVAARWGKWIEYHRSLFGLLTPDELTMVTEWAGLFASDGWLPEHLHEASEWLALHAPPRYRSEHLAAIQERLRSHLRKATQQPQGEDSGWRCVRCQASGFVEVISPKEDTLRPERIRTCVVACDCRAGQRVAQQWAKYDRPILTLAEYARKYPGWEQRLQAVRDLERRQVRTLARTQALDEALGAIQERARQMASKAPQN